VPDNPREVARGLRPSQPSFYDPGYLGQFERAGESTGLGRVTSQGIEQPDYEAATRYALDLATRFGPGITGDKPEDRQLMFRTMTRMLQARPDLAHEIPLMAGSLPRDRAALIPGQSYGDLLVQGYLRDAVESYRSMSHQEVKPGYNIFKSQYGRRYAVYADASGNPVAAMTYTLRPDELKIGILGANLSGSPGLTRGAGLTNIFLEMAREADAANVPVNPGPFSSFTGDVLNRFIQLGVRKGEIDLSPYMASGQTTNVGQTAQQRRAAIQREQARTTRTTRQPGSFANAIRSRQQPPAHTPSTPTSVGNVPAQPAPAPTPAAQATPTKLIREPFYRPGVPVANDPYGHRAATQRETIAQNPSAYAISSVGSHMSSIEQYVTPQTWSAMTDQERMAFANLLYASHANYSHIQALGNLLNQRYGGGGGQP